MNFNLFKNKNIKLRNAVFNFKCIGHVLSGEPLSEEVLKKYAKECRVGKYAG